MNVPNQNKQNPMHPNQDTQAGLNRDVEFEDVLTNFRQSMHAWSEHELTRRPAARLAQPASASRRWLIAPAVSWAAAAALTLAAVGVPLGVHHHNSVIAAQQAEIERQHKAEEARQAVQMAQNKAEEDQLLEHVDTDIAQDTPDAMQPLASLMSGSGAE